MSYANGEVSRLGDQVKNQWGRPGIVTRANGEYIDVRWDDGGIDLLSTPASGFTLVSRKPEERQALRKANSLQHSRGCNLRRKNRDREASTNEDSA